MGIELRPDDFEVGMYITVFQGRIYQPNIISPFFGASTETAIDVREDGSFKGDVLQILAIDLPYIAVEHCDGFFTSPTTFDLRQWKFMRLTEEYVKAARKDT